MTTILLRGRRNVPRFIGKRGWVSSRKRAQTFASVRDAVRFCAANNLDEAEVIVFFDEPAAVAVVVSVPAETAPMAGAESFDAEHGFVIA